MSRLSISFIISVLIACDWSTGKKLLPERPDRFNSLKTVSDISPPSGYKRMDIPANSFGGWLRNILLKKDNRVHLYNGLLKANQSAQFAVLDVRVGNRDLQQCADAILRLRTEYFLNQKQTNRISFKATDGTRLSFTDWSNGVRYKLAGNKLVACRQSTGDTDLRKSLESFLETVFSYCGTISLNNEMHPKSIRDIKPGDVFVKAGSPGHAMIVMDVAMNDAGEKVFMLAQSYMPAQDIHIVKNPVNEDMSPWYTVNDSVQVITPEWVFSCNQLRQW